MNERTDQNSKLPADDSGAKPPVPEQADARKQTQAAASNIIFVGKTERLNKQTGEIERVPRDAPKKINDGETQIKLPSPDEQKTGFYHARATQIIALFPDDYKIPTDKGAKL